MRRSTWTKWNSGLATLNCAVYFCYHHHRHRCHVIAGCFSMALGSFYVGWMCSPRPSVAISIQRQNHWNNMDVSLYLYYYYYYYHYYFPFLFFFNHLSLCWNASVDGRAGKLLRAKNGDEPTPNARWFSIFWNLIRNTNCVRNRLLLLQGDEDSTYLPLWMKSEVLIENCEWESGRTEAPQAPATSSNRSK